MAAPVGNDKVRDLQSEVEGVKNIMSQNVERILARGENLDQLRNKTEDLEASVSCLYFHLYTRPSKLVSTFSSAVMWVIHILNIFEMYHHIYVSTCLLCL